MVRTCLAHCLRVAALTAFMIAGPLAAAGTPCVPFKTLGSPGSTEITGGPPPAPLNFSVEAEGHGIHLGRYVSAASAVITFPAPNVALFDGGGWFTAANGDEVYFDYYGNFFPGPVPGGLGVYEINGGTGRFDGATGSGVVETEGGNTTFDGHICFAH